MVLILVLIGLRIYVVLGIQDRSPPLYEKLGKPSLISRWSWSFLHRASGFAEFRQLPPALRRALRVAQALDVLAIVLLVPLIVSLFRRSS